MASSSVVPVVIAAVIPVYIVPSVPVGVPSVGEIVRIEVGYCDAGAVQLVILDGRCHVLRYDYGVLEVPIKIDL